MTLRPGLFWQTILADLALILFIASASSLDRPEPQEQSEAPHGTQTLAIWRESADAPDLPVWLAQQQAESRTRLVLTIGYAQDGREEAWSRAAELAAKAGEAGRSARIVLEPGAPGIVRASLHYDRCASATGAELACQPE